MSKNFKIVLWSLFGIGAVMAMTGLMDLGSVLEVLFGGSAALAVVTPGVATGTIKEGATTVEGAKDGEGEDYTDIDYNKKIVLIAPSSTPLDTITREIKNTKGTTSIETGGWEMSVRDIEDECAEAILASNESEVGEIKVGKPMLWQPGDTMMVKTATKTHYYYVTGRNLSTSKLTVQRYNLASDPENKFPAVELHDKILRLGRAMNETAAMTTPLNQTPASRTNFCQIHMAQIEESVVHALHKKKIAYDFAVLQEQTIYEFKRAMELTNLFGKKDKFVNPEGEVIYTSDGIWNQGEHQFTYTGDAAFTSADWISLTKEIFEGNNGSERRIAIIGPDLMAKWSNVDAFSKQLDPQNVEVVYGVRFNKVVTNFGELLVKCGTGLFVGANSWNGMVIDPAYLIKYVYEPLQAKELDLDKTGQKRVKSVRLLENYCLYLENQPVHCKILKTA